MNTGGHTLELVVGKAMSCLIQMRATLSYLEIHVVLRKLSGVVAPACAWQVLIHYIHS